MPLPQALEEMGLWPPQEVITRGRKWASKCLVSRGTSASQLISPSLGLLPFSGSPCTVPSPHSQ